MKTMNENKPLYYKRNDDGFFSVSFGGAIVADDLTFMQAATLIDDLSFYGQAINCVYDSNHVCKSFNPNCKACSYGKSLKSK